jgi:hypothetical protein
MKIGIIQGRLSEPKEGFQECPANWQRELYLLGSLGLSHVEWIVTDKNFWINPVFGPSDINPNKVSSLCADFFVSHLFGNKLTIREYLNVICIASKVRGINKVTIPLMENSSVEDDEVRKEIIDLVLPYTQKYPGIRFSFEAELGHKELLEIVSLSDNFTVTYDTGNMTSFGADHSEYIQAVGHKIDNVHLKDRTYDANTVSPGTGDTNFKLVFNELKKIGYNGIYTIQTARGNDGDEVNTILEHKKYFEELYNE